MSNGMTGLDPEQQEQVRKEWLAKCDREIRKWEQKAAEPHPDFDYRVCEAKVREWEQVRSAIAIGQGSIMQSQRPKTKEEKAAHEAMLRARGGAVVI